MCSWTCLVLLLYFFGNVEPKKYPPLPKGKRRKQEHFKTGLMLRGYPDWAFTKTSKKRDSSREEERISISHLPVEAKEFRRIIQNHEIPADFKPSNSDKNWYTPRTRHKQSNVLYAVRCQEECRELYIGETKEPHHKQVAQYRRATSSGQHSAVHLPTLGTVKYVYWPEKIRV